MESKSSKRARRDSEYAAIEARNEAARLRQDTSKQKVAAQKLLIKGIRRRLGGGFSSGGRSEDILG